MTELKPCPFCGAKKVMNTDYASLISAAMIPGELSVTDAKQ